MIAVFISKDTNGNRSVCVALAPGAIFLTKEGTPTSGTTLNPAAARRIALQILEAANQVEGQSGSIPEL